MKILESGYRVLRISQVPNVETWVSIVIVCHNKLCWNKWVPHHLCLFGLDSLRALAIWLGVEVVVV